MSRKKGNERQLGWLDAFAAPNLGRNERLDRIDAVVKWYRFEKLLSPLEPDGPGRPRHLVLLMFKALLLQRWYALSDADLEAQINDRLSFRRFLRLPYEAAAPDHTTICRFRNRLMEEGLYEKLFAEFEKQLDKLGLIMRKGTLVDATLVEAASKRPPKSDTDENDEEATDPDAGFAARQGKPGGGVYGYKIHTGVDQGSLLIRNILTTAANVNETSVAERLFCYDEEAIYADAAYDTKARRALLRGLGIKDRIMHRPNKHHPVLPPHLKHRNRRIAPVRAAVEGVFATFKQRMGHWRGRYVGLAKNQAHAIMLALAHNMRRASILAG
jgi:IS5 family transposase